MNHHGNNDSMLTSSINNKTNQGERPDGTGHIKAYFAAEQVDYESSSQFNHEFKRYFGQSPADDVRSTCYVKFIASE